MNIIRKFKVLINSRKLFKNWLSAGIKYYLVKYGLIKDGINIRCNDREYILSSKAYSSIISNYYGGALKGIECREVIVTITDVGFDISFINDYVEFTYNDKNIRFKDSFEFLNDIIFENFIGGAYDDVDVIGKTVVDVGAGVGDTAILFSLRGAKKVIALEPYYSLYKKALTNIKINSIENNIILLNAGLGSFDGEVCAELNNVNNYILFRPGSRCDHMVRVYTLESLVKEFEIDNEAILKVDCEGCEYETILNTKPEVLRIFDQIVIEYHNGYAELKRVLENAGFKTAIKPIRSVVQPIEVQGYIIARLKA